MNYRDWKHLLAEWEALRGMRIDSYYVPGGDPSSRTQGVFTGFGAKAMAAFPETVVALAVSRAGPLAGTVRPVSGCGIMA